MIKTASFVVLKLTGKEAIMPQQTFKIAKIQMTAIPCRSISFLAQIIFGKLRQRKLHFVDDIFQDQGKPNSSEAQLHQCQRGVKGGGQVRNNFCTYKELLNGTFATLAINMKKHMLRKGQVIPVRDSKKSKKTTPHMSMTQRIFMSCIAYFVFIQVQKHQWLAEC